MAVVTQLRSRPQPSSLDFCREKRQARQVTDFIDARVDHLRFGWCAALRYSTLCPCPIRGSMFDEVG